MDRWEQAGASARAEGAKRRLRREQANRARYGRVLGGAKSTLERVPQSEEAWRRGAEGEVRAARALERALRRADVELLHDRRVPGTRANIDHIAVGPAGITVIDAKRIQGDVRVRRGRLWVGARDRTRLIEGVQRQVELVRSVVLQAGLGEVAVEGALCWTVTDGLPLRRLLLDGIRVLGPRATSRWVRREGPLAAPTVKALAGALDRALPRY